MPAGRAPIRFQSTDGPARRGGCHFRTPGADKPGKTEHLARAQRERYVGKTGRAGEPGDPQELLARLSLHVRREVILEPATNHHFDERRSIHLGDRTRGDVPSIAQDRDRVAQPEDLLEPVADVDARHATVAQPADKRIQTLGFVLRQAARRLIEDDEARALADRRRDLQHLLLTDGQRANRARHVERGVDRRQHRFRAASHLAPGNKTSRRRQAAQAEILGDRQVLAERELLVDHRDARLERIGRAVKADRFAADDDAAFVGRVNAGQQLAERALPRAVLATKRMTGSRGDRERHAIERGDTGETLGDAVEANLIRGHGPRILAEDQRAGKRHGAGPAKAGH